jgi:hypothetical protein
MSVISSEISCPLYALEMLLFLKKIFGGECLVIVSEKLLIAQSSEPSFAYENELLQLPFETVHLQSKEH